MAAAVAQGLEEPEGRGWAEVAVWDWAVEASGLVWAGVAAWGEAVGLGAALDEARVLAAAWAVGWAAEGAGLAAAVKGLAAGWAG